MLESTAGEIVPEAGLERLFAVDLLHEVLTVDAGTRDRGMLSDVV